MEERLHVFFNQNRVGILSLDEKRAFSFSYTREWISHPESFPLSVSMPLQYEAFPDNSSKAFFANLLPESAVRELVARLLGVSEKNDFRDVENINVPSIAWIRVDFARLAISKCEGIVSYFELFEMSNRAKAT